MQVEIGSVGSGGENGDKANGSKPEEKVPAYKQENPPSGKVDQVMWYAFRGKTRKELERPPYSFKPGTIRVGFGKLADLESEWVEAQEKVEIKSERESGEQLPAVRKPGIQVFAKGSPPEAIIESIHIPLVDGQSQGFEMGMKFGMSQLVLAVRIMQELSAIGLQQVRPLIDMTRSVREGEGAAFKSGAEEGAMKAARAMGDTILPMMSELQGSIASVAKGTEADPFKSMMVRTMEPLLKNVLSRLIPGMQEQLPTGWERKTETQ